MSERRIRPSRITDGQVEAFARASGYRELEEDAIRAGLVASYVRREVERVTTPELSHPDLDPYPGTIGDVADEIARFVLELEASGVARGLAGMVAERLWIGRHTDPCSCPAPYGLSVAPNPDCRIHGGFKP